MLAEHFVKPDMLIEQREIMSSIFDKANDEKCSPSAMPTACDLSQFYISCRITGVPPLQSDFSGLSSALKDDTIEPKKRKETRTKPTKMARKKSTLRMTRTTTDKLPTCDYYYNLARRLPTPSPGPALLSAAAGASVYLEPVHP